MIEINNIKILPPPLPKDIRYKFTSVENISCGGFWQYTSNSHDFDCEYEFAGQITCENCIVNGGNFNPITGEKIKHEN